MPEGNLQVFVTESETMLPVIGANVIISEGNDVLYRLYTDISGKTETVVLNTPPFVYSQEPNQPQPYALYNVSVFADGYGDVYISDVQVYADSQAIQNISLVKGNADTEIIIPPPVLYGDYPPQNFEDEVKPQVPESGFSVLDKVVIPEYIVVHDGTPKSSAENYYIPYKDYIKNVASSEIYSTWSIEAIKANIYAIQSFTLNRVFTEWYRSRGYDFTITSSTAYDQSFSYGRTIYESINEIVDDIFNEYIQRSGQIQPLFAQYCDGIEVTCPGQLSQWGSEDLAKQGYTAFDILQYYYGRDISIAEAERVNGVPYSFAGSLGIGSVGSNVTAIQQQLNVIANTYSAIQKIRTDGVYGSATEEAVREFQNIFNLPQTGIVDKATFYEISAIYTALEKLASL